MNVFKAIKFGIYVLTWYSSASKDGKITIEEIVEGALGGLEQAGVNLTVDIPEELLK